jgi:Demerecviridae HNH endonuclease
VKLPKGVCFNPRLKQNPYQARIQVEKKYIGLGHFPSAEMAADAYAKARAMYPRPPRKPRPGIISVAGLAEYVSYCPQSGIVTWKVAPRYAIRVGDPVTSLNSYGYVQACIARRPYLAHRIGWALTHGEWPAVMIDHINGDRADNRIVNLRLATGAQNQANRTARKDSKTGLRGVRFDKKTGKFSAQIQVGGFDTAEEAHAEFIRMAKFCYGEFAPTALIHAVRSRIEPELIGG